MSLQFDILSFFSSILPFIFFLFFRRLKETVVRIRYFIARLRQSVLDESILNFLIF